MSFRVTLGVAVLFGMAVASAGQNQASRPSPRVSLLLPTGVASESVQITYFLGGYGGFVRPVKGQTTYDIDTSVDGHPTAELKAIAYLPGCEIGTVDLLLLGQLTFERQLECKPLDSVALRGQIFPVSITQEEPSEIEVVYLAMWSHEFFGIYDGPVTTIRVATAIPDQDGQFRVNLPNFSKQKLGDGMFQFVLRQATKKNIIAFLRPAPPGLSSHGLKVSSSYDPLVEFQAERR